MGSIPPMSKYLNPVWWREWLVKTFPEDYGYRPLPAEDGFKEETGHFSTQPAWGQIPLNELHWYKNENIYFSLFCRARSRPYYHIKIINGPYLERTFELENAENEILFIEALTQPKLLPLCLDLPYAEPFIAHILRTTQPV